MPESCLYWGEVVHRRLNPVRHELRYRVFNLYADIDQLDQLDTRLRLFSYNRFNLFSVKDRNHGAGDGTPLRDHVWKLARQTSCGAEIARIFMFCYPSVLGYVFNPLTVYYGFDAEAKLRLMIYEVNNTFGGRHSYVIPVDGASAQQAPKRFHVSPFNAVEGKYLFRFSAPSGSIALGVALSVGNQPILKAYVAGERKSLSDANLLRSFLDVPFLTLKVIGAIHLQALGLWWKGMKLKPRPQTAPPSTDVLPKVAAEP
jgi:uncharacterized protein